jgi:hypothetical protein
MKYSTKFLPSSKITGVGNTGYSWALDGGEFPKVCEFLKHVGGYFFII